MKVTNEAPDEVSYEVVEAVRKDAGDNAVIGVTGTSCDDRPAVVRVYEGVLHTPKRFPYAVVGVSVAAEGYTRIHLKDE